MHAEVNGLIVGANSASFLIKEGGGQRGGRGAGEVREGREGGREGKV